MLIDELLGAVHKRPIRTGTKRVVSLLSGKDDDSDKKRKRNYLYSRRFAERHPERVKASRKEYAERNKEHMKALKAAWRKANLDHVRKLSAAWARKWRRANRETHLERVRAAYAAMTPEEKAAKRARARARYAERREEILAARRAAARKARDAKAAALRFMLLLAAYAMVIGKQE